MAELEGATKPCVFKRAGKRAGRRKRKHSSSDGKERGGGKEGEGGWKGSQHTLHPPSPPTEDSDDEESAVVRKERKPARGKLFQKTNTKSLYKPEGPSTTCLSSLYLLVLALLPVSLPFYLSLFAFLPCLSAGETLILLSVYLFLFLIIAIA